MMDKDWVNYMGKKHKQVSFAFCSWLVDFFLTLPQANLHLVLASQKQTLLHCGECSPLICCLGLKG